MAYRSLGVIEEEQAKRWSEAAKKNKRPFTTWAQLALDDKATADLEDKKKTEAVS